MSRKSLDRESLDHVSWNSTTHFKKNSCNNLQYHINNKKIKLMHFRDERHGSNDFELQFLSAEWNKTVMKNTYTAVDGINKIELEALL